MNCTTNWEWLSKNGVREEMNWKEPHGGVCYNPAFKVWCIEEIEKGKRGRKNWVQIKDWRSFYVDNVIDVEIFVPINDDIDE